MDNLILTPFQLVEVSWIDSMSADGWSRPQDLDMEELEEQAYHTSVGYAFRSTERMLHLVQSYQMSPTNEESRQLAGQLSIPWVAILHLRIVG